jgi:hypothetical protein
MTTGLIDFERHSKHLTVMSRVPVQPGKPIARCGWPTRSICSFLT